MTFLLLSWLPGILLTFCRVTAMVVSMLLLGATSEGRLPRLVLAGGLSTAVYASNPVAFPAPDSLPELIFLCGREVLLGLAIGFAVQILITTFRITGVLIGREMGFGLSQVMDPNTGVSTPVVGRFMETLVWLFLFSVNAHHRVFLILSNSFRDIPIGSEWNLEAMKQGLIRLTTDSLALGVRLAVPVYATMMLLTITLVVLARAVPQINMMEFAFAVRILVALVAMMIFLAGLGPLLYGAFDDLLDSVEAMARAMGRT